MNRRDLLTGLAGASAAIAAGIKLAPKKHTVYYLETPEVKLVSFRNDGIEKAYLDRWGNWHMTVKEISEQEISEFREGWNKAIREGHPWEIQEMHFPWIG